jgi:hypothetical protein
MIHEIEAELAHVSLCNLHESADTRDIDDA